MRQETEKSIGNEDESVAGLFSIENKWFQMAFYAVLLAWIGYLLWTAQQWNWTDKLLPFLIAIPAVILIVIKLIDISFPGVVARFRPGNSASESHTSDEETPSSEVEQQYADSQGDASERPKRVREKYELLMIGWVIALPVLIYYLGFTVAVPLYLFSFGVFFTGRIKLSLLISLGFSALLFTFFVSILGVQPWSGVLSLPTIAELIG